MMKALPVTPGERERDRQEIYRLLSLYARGFDPFGNRVEWQQQQEAIRLLNEWEKMSLEAARIETDRLRALGEIEIQQRQLEIEHRKLDIEAQRVQAEKAAVIVRALEVAVQGGVTGDQLLAAINDLGSRLLPAPEERRMLPEHVEVQQIPDTTKAAIAALPDRSRQVR
jgi:hypothetical protein